MNSTLEISVLEEALRYASLGWPIVPDHNPNLDGKCSCGNPECGKIGKHPRIGEWTTGASTVPAVIKRWCRQWPNMNVSVLTGPRSNLAVLDVDPRNGGAESLSALFTPEELESLRTPVALTGGGGNHFFFMYPGSPFKTVADLLPGIEIKADGAKVTLPPSLHASGERYTWELSPFDVEPVPLPQKIIDLISRKRQKDRTTGIEGELIPAGQRNSRLTAYAGALRKQGASKETLESALLAVNEKQCAPPLEEWEVLGIAKSILRKKPEPDPIKKVEVPKVVSAADLQRMNFPPPRWAVPGLIAEGLTILAGAPKLGKSYLALSICLSVAQGRSVLSSIETEPGDVLMVALEDPMPRLKRRIENLAYGETWPERLHVMNDCPRAHEGGIEFLNTWLEEHPETRLVVIDTFQRFRKPQKGNANAYAEDYEAVAGLKAVADRHRVGILVLHHTKKGQVDDPLESTSGTMGISGAADTNIRLVRARGQGNADMFITGRDVEERTLALKFDEGGWKLEGDAEEVRRSDSRKAVLQAIEEAGYPMMPREIADVLGRPRGTIRRLIHELTYEKSLIPLDGDRYTTSNMASTRNEAISPNVPNSPNTPSLFGGVRLD